MVSIGIDVGTTKICAIAVEVESGIVLQSITEPNDTFLKPANSWERLQQPDVILAKTFRLTEQLCETFTEIVSIGVTGQMHGIVYLDDAGNAVSSLYTWQDESGNQPFEGSTYALKLSAVTGYACNSGFGLVTHYYLLKNGLIPKKAVSLCTIQDYIAMRLCGLKRPVIHTSDAASLSIFDLKSGAFDVKALAAAGIEQEVLPKVTGGTAVLGKYRGIPVAVAIGDNQASYLGSVKGEDCLLINVGTGSQVSMCAGGWQAPDSCEVRPLYETKGILVGSSLCGGRAYAMLEQFFRACVFEFSGVDAGSLYQKMMQLALNCPIKRPLQVSTLFCGTRLNPELRGAITEIGTDNFDPQSLIAGILNGMVDELEQMFLEMRQYSSGQPRCLIASGNGIRLNPPLQKLLEERFSMPLMMPAHQEEASFGAAVFSAVAAGRYSDIAMAQENMIHYETQNM